MPVSEGCEKALLHLALPTPSELARAMLNASGTKSDDFAGCQRLGPVAHYCLAQLGMGDTIVDTRAVCAPANCSAADITSALTTASPKLSSYAVHCGDHTPGPLTAGAWCTVLVLVLLTVLVLVGTVVHALEKRRQARMAAEDALLQPFADGSPATQRGAAQRRGAATKVLLAFSLIENVRFLLLPSPSRRFTALEGVRAISMFWIILAHTLDFQSYVGFDEPFKTVEGQTLGTWPFQAVISGSFAVDGFFLLSGFLGAHVLLRRPKHIGLPAFVLRYLRLTPTLALVLAVYTTLAPQLGAGPHWFKMGAAAAPCRTWWWSNLLYVNNFAPAQFTEMCMGWTWYLACDTQMFLVSLPLLAMRASKRRALRAAAAALCVLGVVACVAQPV